MIITRLLGGLGNQMFQYAAGLALAEARRTTLKLDVSWFREYAEHGTHNRYGLSCFNNTEQFATEEEIDRARGVRLTRAEKWSVSLARALRFRRYVQNLQPAANWYRPPSFRFHQDFFSQPDNTYLEGMFQSEQFFAPIAGLLRSHFSFRYPATPEVAAMIERIRSGPSAALHFRRGDYAQNTTYKTEFGVIGAGYYQRAANLLRERNHATTLYIFSDDIDAVAKDFQPAGPHVFVRCVTPWNPHDELRMMSACEHIAIANSSFSWWAAWLNPNPEKLVIAPSPWFVNNKEDMSDVIPSRWQRLSV